MKKQAKKYDIYENEWNVSCFYEIMITYNFLVKKVQSSRISFTWKKCKEYDLYKTELSVSCFYVLVNDHLQLFIKKNNTWDFFYDLPTFARLL